MKAAVEGSSTRLDESMARRLWKAWRMCIIQLFRREKSCAILRLSGNDGRYTALLGKRGSRKWENAKSFSLNRSRKDSHWYH